MLKNIGVILFPLLIALLIGVPIGVGGWIGFNHIVKPPSIVTPVVPPVVVPPVVVPPVPTPVVPVIPSGPVDQPAYVQLGTYKTANEAKVALQALFATHPTLYDPLKLRVYRVTLKNGTWYRIMLPVDNAPNGNDLCGKLKTVKQDCLVLTF